MSDRCNVCPKLDPKLQVLCLKIAFPVPYIHDNRYENCKAKCCERKVNLAFYRYDNLALLLAHTD